MHTRCNFHYNNDYILDKSTHQEKIEFKQYLKREFNVNVIGLYSDLIEFNASIENTVDYKLNIFPKVVKEVELFSGYRPKEITHDLIIAETLPNEENIIWEGYDITVVCGKGIENLKNIHKIISKENRQLVFKNIWEIKSHALGLILLNNNIIFRNMIRSRNSQELTILLKYINTSDILECQEELITHGFKEYAKL